LGPESPGGDTDADGDVIDRFGSCFDPSTTTAVTTSSTDTAMPNANAATRLFLDFPS